MTRSNPLPTALALILIVTVPAARAQAPLEPAGQVARAFIAAARAQDRRAALQLLDEQVSIRFPAAGEGEGRAAGRPFVIGYLDGLFGEGRALSLDDAAANGQTVRFLAHDRHSQARYAIEVEVRGARVVGVAVAQQAAPPATAVAALDAS